MTKWMNDINHFFLPPKKHTQKSKHVEMVEAITRRFDMWINNNADDQLEEDTVIQETVQTHNKKTRFEH